MNSCFRHADEVVYAKFQAAIKRNFHAGGGRVAAGVVVIGTHRRPANQRGPREAKMAVRLQFCRGQKRRGNIGANSSTDPTTPREDVLSR